MMSIIRNAVLCSALGSAEQCWDTTVVELCHCCWLMSVLGCLQRTCNVYNVVYGGSKHTGHSRAQWNWIMTCSVSNLSIYAWCRQTRTWIVVVVVSLLGGKILSLNIMHWSGMNGSFLIISINKLCVKWIFYQNYIVKYITTSSLLWDNLDVAGLENVLSYIYLESNLVPSVRVPV